MHPESSSFLSPIYRYSEARGSYECARKITNTADRYLARRYPHFTLLAPRGES